MSGITLTENADRACRATAMFKAYGERLQATARRLASCQQDAEDAFQRTCEIYLKRLDSIEPATELNWLHTVLKHEIFAQKKQRQRTVLSGDLQLEQLECDRTRGPFERTIDSEIHNRRSQLLKAIKPDECKALILKGLGFSYQEISEHENWTYTKVNRCITEGRRRLRALERNDLRAGIDRAGQPGKLPTIKALQSSKTMKSPGWRELEWDKIVARSTAPD